MILPKMILFDLGGVIEQISPSNVASAFKRLGMDNPERFFSLEGQSQLCEDFELGKVSSSDFVSSIQKKLPSATHQQIIDAWNSNLLGVAAETTQVLQTLRMRGHQLFALSNTNALHFEKIKMQFLALQGFPFCYLFDQVFVSYEIGLRKPTRAFFTYVLEALFLGASPGEAIFIDDIAVNTASARALGLQVHTHLINSSISYLLSGSSDICKE